MTLMSVRIPSSTVHLLMGVRISQILYLKECKDALVTVLTLTSVRIHLLLYLDECKDFPGTVP